MWPMLLDYSRDECKRILRCLELEAYASVVSAFRAQGSLTKEKKKMLQDLSSALCISLERHRAEVRRAVNDERLNTIAERISGPNTSTEWAIEGRRLIPLMPRLVPQTAFTAIANSAANIQAAKNAAMPPPGATGKKDCTLSPPPTPPILTTVANGISTPSEPLVPVVPDLTKSTSVLSSPTVTTPTSSSPSISLTSPVSTSASPILSNPKSTVTSNANSSIVVLPSGMSIHIKGGEGSNENDFGLRKRKQSPSLEGLPSTQKLASTPPSGPLMTTTVTLPSSTSSTSSTGNGQVSSSLRTVGSSMPMRITLASSSTRTPATFATAQSPKVILVSTAGGSTSPSILHKSLNVPVVKTVSPNTTTTVSANQSTLSMMPYSVSSIITSSALGLSSTTPLPASITSTSSSIGGVISSTLAPTSLQPPVTTGQAEGPNNVSTTNNPSPFVSSTLQPSALSVMKTRPKTPVQMRQQVRPRSSIVVPGGPVQVVVPPSATGSPSPHIRQGSVSPETPCLPNLGTVTKSPLPVARATVQYRQEGGGLKVITQSIPMQASKLFPKSSNPSLSHLVVVTSANVTPSSMKQSLVSSAGMAVGQSSGSTKVVSVISNTQPVLKSGPRQSLSPTLSPACRSALATAVKVTPSLLGQTTPIVVRAAPPGMKPNVIVVHKSQVLQHVGSQGRTIVVSSGSPVGKMASVDTSKLGKFKPPLARTITIPAVTSSTLVASSPSSSGITFTTFTSPSVPPQMGSKVPLKRDALEKQTPSPLAKPGPQKEADKEGQKSNLLADLILATGILSEGGGSSVPSPDEPAPPPDPMPSSSIEPSTSPAADSSTLTEYQEPFAESQVVKLTEEPSKPQNEPEKSLKEVCGETGLPTTGTAITSSVMKLLQGTNLQSSHPAGIIPILLQPSAESQLSDESNSGTEAISTLPIPGEPNLQVLSSLSAVSNRSAATELCGPTALPELIVQTSKKVVDDGLTKEKAVGTTLITDLKHEVTSSDEVTKQKSSVLDAINAATATAHLNLNKLQAEASSLGQPHTIHQPQEQLSVLEQLIGSTSFVQDEPVKSDVSKLDGEKAIPLLCEIHPKGSNEEELTPELKGMKDDDFTVAKPLHLASMLKDSKESAATVADTDEILCAKVASTDHEAVSSSESNGEREVSSEVPGKQDTPKVQNVENDTQEIKEDDMQVLQSSLLSPLTVQFSADENVQDTVVITESLEEVVSSEVATDDVLDTVEEIVSICDVTTQDETKMQTSYVAVKESYPERTTLTKTSKKQVSYTTEEVLGQEFKCVEPEKEENAETLPTNCTIASCHLPEETVSSVGSEKEAGFGLSTLETSSIRAINDCTVLSEDPEIAEALDAAETTISCVTGSVVESDCGESTGSLSQEEISQPASSSLASSVSRIAMFSLIDNMMNTPIDCESKLAKQLQQDSKKDELITDVVPSVEVSCVDIKEEKEEDILEAQSSYDTLGCIQSVEGSTSFKTWDASLCEQTVSAENVVVEICDDLDVPLAEIENEGAGATCTIIEAYPVQEESYQTLQLEDIKGPTIQEDMSALSDDQQSCESNRTRGRRKRKASTSLPSIPLSPHLTGWARVASGLLERICKYRSPGRSKNELFAHWFMEPVTAEEAPGYFDVVKNPMDFSTIKKKLEATQYKDLSEFHSDMMLVKQNCELYNPPEHSIRQDCEELFTYYLQEYNRLVEKWQKSHLLSSPKRAKF